MLYFLTINAVLVSIKEFLTNLTDFKFWNVNVANFNSFVACSDDNCFFKRVPWLHYSFTNYSLASPTLFPRLFSPAVETLHLPCYYLCSIFPGHRQWLTHTSLSCASEAYSLASSQFRFYQQHWAPPAHRPSASAARLHQLGALSYEHRV